jgi:hypothetical protein
VHFSLLHFLCCRIHQLCCHLEFLEGFTVQAHFKECNAFIVMVNGTIHASDGTTLVILLILSPCCACVIQGAGGSHEKVLSVLKLLGCEIETISRRIHPLGIECQSTGMTSNLIVEGHQWNDRVTFLFEK